MPRTARDSKFYQAECVLSDYQRNKLELAKLKHEIIMRTANKPEIQSPSGYLSDVTASRGIECVEGPQVLRYEADIAAVEKLIGNGKEGDARQYGEYECHPRWYEIKKAIELRYWKGTHSIQGVSLWLELNKEITISDRWLGELVSGFIWRLRDELYGCQSPRKVI